MSTLTVPLGLDLDAVSELRIKVIPIKLVSLLLALLAAPVSAQGLDTSSTTNSCQSYDRCWLSAKSNMRQRNIGQQIRIATLDT